MVVVVNMVGEGGSGFILGYREHPMGKPQGRGMQKGALDLGDVISSIQI